MDLSPNVGTFGFRSFSDLFWMALSVSTNFTLSEHTCSPDEVTLGIGFCHPSEFCRRLHLSFMLNFSIHQPI